MTSLFITGTDTGVGKTVVSAVLTMALGYSYWKPIQTGLADDKADYDSVKELTALPDQYFHPSCYKLQPSLSPEQAAEIEGKTISLANCIPPVASHLIVEGAGGVYVPINDSACMLDLIEQLAMPVIIVSRGTLGTINHTLLTISALKQRNLPIKGVIFNGELNVANQYSIEKWGKVSVLLHIPYFHSHHELKLWILNNRQIIKEAIL